MSLETDTSIKEAAVKKPGTFQVRVENLDKTIEVNTASLPLGDTGKAGSILDILLHAGVEIDHACGGVCACATCHVYVKEGSETCPAAEEDENDMLDMAPDLKSNSRLACQCVPTGEKDIVVEIPSWNRNYAREGA
ncbi:2Fe-2S iron-sulfur cluster binding domain-containing protein [bacterium]|nr:2Fe-2S iron-sulfur cluster binding domain-containing protein [bacterium]